MKPCDCVSIDDTKRFLKEQGIAYNDWSMMVRPNSVIIENKSTRLKIPMIFFKRFAEWYLEDQNESGDLVTISYPGCLEINRDDFTFIAQNQIRTHDGIDYEYDSYNFDEGHIIYTFRGVKRRIE